MKPLEFGSPKKAARSLEYIAKEICAGRMAVISMEVKVEPQVHSGIFSDERLLVTGPKQVRIDLLEIIPLKKTHTKKRAK